MITWIYKILKEIYGIMKEKNVGQLLKKPLIEKFIVEVVGGKESCI